MDFLKDLMLGGTSGVIAKTLCAPFERVKIVLQTQSANTQISSGSQYKGIGDTFRRILAEQGVLSFWRGNFANCLRYFPTQGYLLPLYLLLLFHTLLLCHSVASLILSLSYSLLLEPTYSTIMPAMNFAFKERYQALFVRPKEEVGFAMFFLGYLAAGGAAGATSLTVSYPLEYTYTRMAADVGGQYNGIIDCLTKTVKSDGVLGLYRGYGPSVAGIVVYRAGYFGLYDFSKTSLIPSLGLKGMVASSS